VYKDVWKIAIAKAQRWELSFTVPFSHLSTTYFIKSIYYNAWLHGFTWCSMSHSTIGGNFWLPTCLILLDSVFGPPNSGILLIWHLLSGTQKVMIQKTKTKTILNIDNNNNICFLSSKLGYWNDIWRIMWHWRRWWKSSFAIAGINFYILKYKKQKTVILNCSNISQYYTLRRKGFI